MRRLVRRVFMLSVVAGTAYAVWRWFESQRSDSGLSWEAQPAPFPPQPRAEVPQRRGGPGHGPRPGGQGPGLPRRPAHAAAGSGAVRRIGGPPSAWRRVWTGPEL